MTRVFAIVTGTLGLLAVGTLMLTFTPRRQESPVALSATTTPVTLSAGNGVAAIARQVPVALGIPVTRPVARQLPGLATPIGDGQRAVMTASGSNTEVGTEIDVQLTSGPVVTAVVDETASGIVIVSITSDASAPLVDGHAVASSLPAPDEIVTVLADPPVSVAFADVASVDADEGTPVLDRHGELVGLCTRGERSTALIDVTDQPAISEQPAAATSVAP